MSIASVTRRRLLGAGAAALAAPAFIRGARASSGQLNFLGWAGYDELPAVFAAFEKKTGIKVKFTGFGSQDEFLAQAKAGGATNGSFDISEPTADRLGGWLAEGFIQPWDEAKAGAGGYDPAFMQGAVAKSLVVEGKRYGMPSVWGTESVTYDTAKAKLDAATVSLADVFDDRFAGKLTLRGHSGLATIGRLLEAQGKLPLPFDDAFVSEENMTKIYDEVLKFALAKRKNVAQFWSNENEAQGAFRTNGCVVGINWDTSASAMIKEGLPIAYVSPKEGAMAWLQGYVLLKGAKNVEQAHEWIKFMASPEGSYLYAKAFSANPTAKGAVEKFDDSFKKFYAMAYPGDAAQRLWWWPEQKAWFVAKRTEYAKKFMSA